jgi:hypothetical protein
MRIEEVGGCHLDALNNFEPAEEPSQAYSFLAEGDAPRLIHVQELAYAAIVFHKLVGFSFGNTVRESASPQIYP